MMSPDILSCHRSSRRNQIKQQQAGITIAVKITALLVTTLLPKSIYTCKQHCLKQMSCWPGSSRLQVNTVKRHYVHIYCLLTPVTDVSSEVLLTQRYC
jgi:hypothetical protein